MIKNYWNKLDSHLKELFKGASIAFVLKVIAAGCAFGLNIVLARLLGPENFGIYNLAFTIIFISAAFGRIGMENALVRFIASYSSLNKHHKIFGIYNLAIKYSLFTSIFLSLFIFISSPFISSFIFSKPKMEETLTILSLSIVPLALLTLHASSLQGLKKIVSSVTVLSISTPLFAGIAAILFIPIFGLVASAWSYLLASTVSLFLGRLLWIKATKELAPTEAPSFSKKELLSSSKPLFIGVITYMTILWSPILILGIWETNENIGIYSAANRTATLTSFILIAVNSIAAPKFAAIYKQGKIGDLERVARESGRIMMLLALPVALIFIIFPEFVLSLFGNQFKCGASILVILSVGQYINVATGSVGFLLMMTGNERLMRNNLIFCMILELLLCFWLIPLYGIVGAAVVSTTILILQNLIAMALVKKQLGITTLPLLKL